MAEPVGQEATEPPPTTFRWSKLVRECRWSFIFNALLIAVVVSAWQFSHLINLVTNSPSRYSIIVVPFALGAVSASLLSFIQYGRHAPLLCVIGGVGAGWVLWLFFDDFPPDRTNLLDLYMDRIADIGYGILFFSVLSLSVSIHGYFNLKNNHNQHYGHVLDKREFWLLKAIVCDTPVILACIALLFIQIHGLDAASPKFTDVYVDLFQSFMGNNYKTKATPEYFMLQKFNTDTSNLNFWIGVSLGVTSALLIAQQLGTLMLEIFFVCRNKV